MHIIISLIYHIIALKFNHIVILFKLLLQVPLRILAFAFHLVANIYIYNIYIYIYIYSAGAAAHPGLRHLRGRQRPQPRGAGPGGGENNYNIKRCTVLYYNIIILLIFNIMALGLVEARTLTKRCTVLYIYILI